MTLQELKDQIIKEAQAKVEQAEKDATLGRRDCKLGIYDKWYRYHRKDDGLAYDIAWMEQNELTKNETVKFIGHQ